MSAHPADSEPGDAFRDEDGVTATATADGEALGRLVRDVRDAEEPGYTCTIDGVLIAKVDTYGQTAGYRAALTRIADALRVAHGSRIDVDGLVRAAKAASETQGADWCTLTHFDTPDPSNPAQLRLVVALLDELRASGEMDGYQGSLAVIARELSIRADHLDADAADHIKAVEFAEDLSFYGALNSNGRSQLVTALVEFRRAGRDAKRGA